MARNRTPRAQAKQISVALNKDADKAIKALALESHALLQENTRRDTSFARSNWIPKVGEKEEKAFGSKQSVQFIAANIGRNEVSRYKMGQGKIYISNNASYIQIIANVYDPGYIDVELAKAIQAVVQAFRKSRRRSS